MKQRIVKLRETLATNKIDALLVSNFYNILYLTGFSTPVTDEREAWTLITQKKVYVFVDGRNSEALYDHGSKHTHLIPLVISSEKPLIAQLEEIAKKENLKIFGFEAHDLTVAEYKYLKKKLPFAFKPQEDLVADLRAIKDDSEIKKIKRAAAVADRCLTEVASAIKAGQTEADVAYKIEQWLKEKGHDISFYPIVASGAAAAIPHYHTKRGNKKIKKGELLLIDYGAKVDDYCSDTTRMFTVGEVSNELQNIYQKLLEAQKKTIQKIKKGVELKALDIFVRQEMKKQDLPDFSHGTGHGVGLEVHEAPTVSFKSKDIATAGQVFTIEPGIYVPGKYGMRIEDMILVTSSGPEVLTRIDKSLRVL